MKKLLPLFALAALALAVVTPTSAHAFLDLLPKEPGGGAPEIDPSAIGSAIALVIGGAALLRDRVRR